MSNKVYLYRCIRINNFLEGGVPSSSIFIDAKRNDGKKNDGCSVEYAGGRTEDEIFSNFKTRFLKHNNYFGVTRLSEDKVRTIKNLDVKSAPSKNNLNHALIYDIHNQEISLVQARFLARYCEIIQRTIASLSS